MHEARTKNDWYINATAKELAGPLQRIFIIRSGHKNKVYRTTLHYLLKVHLDNYSADLRKADAEGARLRRFLARKMDHIYDIPPDPAGFDWWKP